MADVKWLIYRLEQMAQTPLNYDAELVRETIAALSHAAGQDVDKGPWEAEIVAGKVVICSDDFAHDVWLYVTGDFENNDEALAYAGHLADKLNSPAVARSEGSD